MSGSSACPANPDRRPRSLPDGGITRAHHPRLVQSSRVVRLDCTHLEVVDAEHRYRTAPDSFMAAIWSQS